jgi:hypothetical protein
MASTVKAPVWSNHAHQHEGFWDFQGQVDRRVVTGMVTAGANANDDVGATALVLTGTEPMLITDAFATVSANSAGIDANNTSAWAIAAAGATLVTYTANADFVANTSYNMGAIVTGYVAANTAVTLAITNGTAADLNSAICTVSLGYVPADSLLSGLKVIATNGGSVSVADGVLGVLAITPSDGTAGDNDEIYLCTDTELFKFAAGDSFETEIRWKYSEAATDDANLFYGFMNAFAADALVDDGGGPKATGDYVGFWKVDGGTQWYCGAQSNGTATPSVDALGVPNTTSASSDYVVMHVRVDCKTSTQAVATFTHNGTVLGTVNFAYASATEMQVGLGVKNGSTNAETVYVDYLGYVATR